MSLACNWVSPPLWPSSMSSPVLPSFSLSHAIFVICPSPSDSDSWNLTKFSTMHINAGAQISLPTAPQFTERLSSSLCIVRITWRTSPSWSLLPGIIGVRIREFLPVEASPQWTSTLYFLAICKIPRCCIRYCFFSVQNRFLKEFGILTIAKVFGIPPIYYNPCDEQIFWWVVICDYFPSRFIFKPPMVQV